MEHPGLSGQYSVASVVAEAWQSCHAFQLSREETAFIAGIYAYLPATSTLGLDEEELRRIYTLVYELAKIVTDTEVQRATHIIGHLKEQGILLRTDAGGLSSEGEYALSALGMAMGEAMESDRTLSKRSLEFMLTHMRTELAQILSSAQHADSVTAWEEKVLFPMRYVMLELISAVDKRQLGLDMAHKLLRQRITALFDREWLKAADSCMEMIKDVGETLRELHAVLSEHVQSIARLLQDLLLLVPAHTEVASLVERAQNQVLRLEAWGTQRNEDWSSYHRSVQVHIRDFVQTDPDNQLRGRLIEQIRKFQQAPYRLVVVGPESFLHLRDVLPPGEDVPLVVSADILSGQGVAEITETTAELVDELVAAVLQQLKTDGEIDIVAAVNEVCLELSDKERFQVLQLSSPKLLDIGVQPGEPYWEPQPWKRMSPRLEAQTLKLQLRTQRPVPPSPPPEHASKEPPHDLPESGTSD